MHLQNPYFYFFANVPKIIKDIKNKFKNKGQLWNLHYQISLTQLKNLFKKLVQTIYFFQNWPFFGTYAGQNTTLSLPKDVFSYRNPFDNCLIVKNWNPKKWLTLVYSVYTHSTHRTIGLRICQNHGGIKMDWPIGGNLINAAGGDPLCTLLRGKGLYG